MNPDSPRPQGPGNDDADRDDATVADATTADATTADATTDNATTADAEMRLALASLDPVGEDSPEHTATAVEQAWMRIETTTNFEDGEIQVPAAPSQQGRRPSPSAAPEASPPPRRRLWELAAAACLGAALVGGSVLLARDFTSGGSDSAVVAGESGSVAVAPGDAAVSSTEPYAGDAVDGSASASTSAGPGAGDASIARSASATVATEDPRSARDEYVATVTGLGGSVTSETITSSGAGNGPVQPMPADAAIYPPIYSGAGIFLDVEVPAAQYDQAIAAISPLGEVIELSQSSYDTGTSLPETEARIAALQQSLGRLQALLSQASNVGEVIQLENAITARQSELDALAAQQGFLASQVEKSRISLRLITPADAQDLNGASDTWWGSFTAGISEAWMWLGRALAWTSPLWIGGLVWWLLRRRRNHRAAGVDHAESESTRA